MTDKTIKITGLFGGSLLSFYYKYADQEEKTVSMNIFRYTYVDINDDGKDDFKVRARLYPSIVQPFSLAINLKTKIDALNGFDDLDENAFLKTKIIFERPGLLFSDKKGDEIGFGYVSDEGEEIPSSCDLTYKYVPHFLSLNKKPEHRLNINVDEQASGSNLGLIFDYHEYNGSELLQKDEFKINYSPMVDTEITLQRKPGAVIEFKRERQDSSDVDLLLKHWKNDNTSYVYSNDLPEHVTFNLDFGADGCVEFDTHGDRVTEIGFYDSPTSPSYKIFFSNLGGKAGVDWYRNLIGGVANVSVYADSADTGFNVELNGENDGFVDFQVSSYTSYDAALEVNLPEGYIKLLRSDSNLMVNLDAEFKDETVGSILNSATASFQITNEFTSPFVLIFDKIGDGIVEVNLSGKSLNIQDLEFSISSPVISGELSVSADHLIKEKQGNISLNVSVDEVDGNISGYVGFKAEKGIDISNLTIKYNNGVVVHKDSIVSLNTVEKNWPFVFNISVEWHIFNNSGYVLIHPDSYASFGFYSTYSNQEEGVIATISGEIRFKSLDRDFNVSWETIDGNLSISLDGSVLASLKDFNFWVKDKVDISIPEISVAFDLNTNNKDGTLSLILDDSVVTCNVTIDKINLTDLFDITLKGSLDVVLDAAASGNLDIAWNESGIKSINGDFGADATGSIDLTDFEFKYKTLVCVSIGNLFISGNLNFNVTSINGNLSLHSEIGLTDIVIDDVTLNVNYIFIPDWEGPGAVSMDLDVTFTGGGIISLSFENGTFKVDAAIYDDSDIVINSLWALVPGMWIEANIESLYITGKTTVWVNVDTSKEVPFTATFSTTEATNADLIYIGYLNLQIYVIDFVSDPGKGNITLGINKLSGMPVIIIRDKTFHIGYLNLFGIVATNVTITGNAHLSGFLDISSFKWVYLRGEINENTTFTFEDAGISIVLEPGLLDLTLQTNMGEEDAIPDFFSGEKENLYLYLFGHSSSWIDLKSETEDKTLISAMGTLDLWVYLQNSDDGTMSGIVDAKEVSAAVVVYDVIRLAGELSTKVDFSINIKNDGNGNVTISDLYINVTGEASGVIQIKGNSTDWIPIFPFNTSGQVLIFRSKGFQGPDIVIGEKGEYIQTSSGYVELGFEVWYAPPFSLNGNEDIAPYTYNISFDDGTYFEKTTDKTWISVEPHVFNIGNYTPIVTVTTSNTLIDPVNDSIGLMIIPGAYVTIVDHGPRNFLYNDSKDETIINTWFTIGNDAKEDYTLHWQIKDINEIPDGTSVYLDETSGILGPNKTIRINVTITITGQGVEDSFTVRVNNSAYSEFYKYGVKDAATTKKFAIDNKFDALAIWPINGFSFPDIKPGGNMTASFWIFNWVNINKPVNWSIVDYPQPENGSWTISPMSGNIPNMGAQIVHFTIQAPNENGIDLGGNITVMNVDDPTETHTITINVKTRGQGSGDGDVTVSEDENGNVSIAIGGSNEIHVNNFQFTINGVAGMLDGHFIFDTNDSYVYINFTEGNFLQTFTIEGSAEFTIQGFRFSFGENISINVSRVITGGFNWYEGRSGCFNMAIDDTFTNIDIELDFDYNTTDFTLAGKIDIDVTNNANGTLFIDWDFNGEDKDISIDSDLFVNKDITVSFTNIYFQVNNFFLSADEIYFDRKVNLSFNNTKLYIETSTIIYADNINFDINTGDFKVELSGVGIQIDGFLLFEVKINEGFSVYCNTSHLHIEANGELWVYYGEYSGRYWATGTLDIYGEFWIILELT